MPRIEPYQQQTRSPRAESRTINLDSGAGAAALGSALESVANDQARLREFAQKKVEERAAVQANEQVMGQRSRWAEELPKRQEAASETAEGFALQTLTDFDAEADELIKGASTEGSRNWLKSRLNEVRLGLQHDAQAFEAQRGAEFKVNGLTRSIDSARTAAEFQPDSFSTLAAEQKAAIEASGLSANTRDKLQQRSLEALATASVQGMIRRDPKSALGELNNEKATNSAVRALNFDARQQLRNAAESEIRQREALTKQAQYESRQALTERVQDATTAYRLGLDFDAPPSRSEFVAALGADGNKAYESFTREQQLGADMKALASMPESEQAELLAERAPSGTEGVAADAQRHRVLVNQVEHLRAQRKADPAAYVARYSPRVEAAWEAAQESPEAASVYATATLAEQRRLGVAHPRVLPDTQASAIAGAFDGKNGEQVVALIQSEQQKWGAHWPKVFGELAAKKMPAAALAIGRGMEPGPATRLASVAALPMEELQKGVSTPPADVRRNIATSMSDFQSSLDGVIGGESTFRGMYDAVERLSYSYLRQGKPVDDATEQAFKEVLGSHYTFREVGGRTFRVPSDQDGATIESGARSALDRVPTSDLDMPVPTGTEEEAAGDLARTIKKRGYWVTSADGERGLTLFLDGAPVLRRGGEPYSLTWEQLRETDAATRQESLQRARVRAATTGTAGLR